MLSFDDVDAKGDFNQIEKAVMRAKKEWEPIFDALSDMLILTNAEGRIARCNQATIRRLQASYGELVGRPFAELFPEAAKADSLGCEMQLFDDRRWYKVSSLPSTLGETLVNQVYLFQEINKQKELEQEILEEKAFYENLFSEMQVAAAVIDSRGTILKINSAFEKIFGYTQTEARGLNLKTLTSAREVSTWKADAANPDDRKSNSTLVKCSNKNGGSLFLVSTEVPIRLNHDTQGSLVQFLEVIQGTAAGTRLDSTTATGKSLLMNLNDRLETLLKDMVEMITMLEGCNLTENGKERVSSAREDALCLLELLAEFLNAEAVAPEIPDKPEVEDVKAGSPQKEGINSKSSTSSSREDLPRILIVEDNPINQKLMLRLLQKTGFQIQTSDNGAAALRLCNRQSFDIIFMDVQMPEMDGLEATRRIRQRELDNDHAVIIALTAEGPAADRMECLRAGMDDFLAKPLDVERLFMLLDKYSPQPLPATIKRNNALSNQRGYKDLIDLPAALPRFGGSPEVYFELLNSFVKQLKQTEQKMRAAYQNGEVAKLHALSHALKGTAANFEVLGIRDFASSLEELTSNNTLVGAYALINDIGKEIPLVEAFYHNYMMMRKKNDLAFSVKHTS